MWDSARIAAVILIQTDRQRLVAIGVLFAVIRVEIDPVTILAEEKTMDKLIAFMWDKNDGFPLWWQGDSIHWMVEYIDDLCKMDINPVPNKIFKRSKIFVWEGKCEHWDPVNGPTMRGVWRHPTVEDLMLLTALKED